MKLKTYRFLIRDDKFLEKYIEIWDKVSYTIGKEIDSNPVYNKIYIKKNSDEEDSSEEENSSEEEDSVEEDSNEEEDSDKKNHVLPKTILLWTKVLLNTSKVSIWSFKDSMTIRLVGRINHSSDEETMKMFYGCKDF